MPYWYTNSHADTVTWDKNLLRLTGVAACHDATLAEFICDVTHFGLMTVWYKNPAIRGDRVAYIKKNILK